MFRLAIETDDGLLALIVPELSIVVLSNGVPWAVPSIPSMLITDPNGLLIVPPPKKPTSVAAVLQCDRILVVQRAAEAGVAPVRGVDGDKAGVGELAGRGRELPAADPIEEPAGKVKRRTPGADDESVAVEHKLPAA